MYADRCFGFVLIHSYPSALFVPKKFGQIKLNIESEGRKIYVIEKNIYVIFI